MVVKNGKAPARRKSASSSAKSSRSNSVPKSNSRSNNGKAADKLDGNFAGIESPAVESEAGDRVLEIAGTAESASGNDLSSESVELTAITLHQPWASLIANGHKRYETRDWPTTHRGLIAIHAGRKPKGKQELREHDKVVTSFDDLLTEDCPYSSVIAIAQMTDCILMTEDFIKEQSATELRCGDWKAGRYAFKLENIQPITPIQAAGKQGLWKWNSDSWNPDDFGELHHKADEGGQLNLLEWVDEEPPDPDDYEFREEFVERYKEWAARQTGTAEEELANFGEQELCNQLIDNSKFAAQSASSTPVQEAFDRLVHGNGAVILSHIQTRLLNLSASEKTQTDKQLATEKEKCNTLTDGSTFAQESALASPMPESNCGSEALIGSANGIATANQSSNFDSPESSSLPTLNSLISPAKLPSPIDQNSSQLPLPVSPSQLTESDSQPTTTETAFLMCSEQSENSNQNLQLSKTSPDSSTAPIPPATNQEAISAISLTPYPRSGSMWNGKLSAAPTLPAPGVESESLLLRSPGALSGGENSRPPGKSRLETQLNQLGLIQDGEVVAPEFLELGYNLPVGYTNPQESRTALELSQVQVQQSSIDQTQMQQPIAHKSELLLATETTAIEGKHSETPLTGESQLSDCAELNISVALPPNIGALSKTELLSLAQEQHQLICVIERKQSELALEKLHRIYVTGVCLVEFKKKCQYGEFIEQIESRGISARSAQQYTFVAKNWETIEAKAKLVSLLPEESQPAIGLKWALETVRDEKKHLKSAAPPKDPDGWRTPDTKDQPVVSLVKKSLGGSIWLDPCSGSSSNIPAAVRYYKQDDGLAHHQTWSKTVFINPPFSDPFPWVERCCLEFARGNVSAAIMLLKAGVVNNVGTGELINKYASAICHWRGRINFLNDEGNAVKGSDFDCVFVYFGARLDLFRQAFQQRGTIATIDNHYSSVNKKFLETAPLPEPQTLKSEQKQLAAAVGLGNGRSVLPDRRDFDRELAERYDPHTVVDVLSTPTMPTSTPTPVSENLFEPLDQPEVFDETPLANRQFEKAKQNTLNDYITAISSNISEFSNDQIAFLAKIINEESAKRIDF